jgi:hypothetical protein
MPRLASRGIFFCSFAATSFAATSLEDGPAGRQVGGGQYWETIPPTLIQARPTSSADGGAIEAVEIWTRPRLRVAPLPGLRSDHTAEQQWPA